MEETLEDFLKSFYYGSRTDLQFKFLADLPPEEGGEFFSDLLQVLGKAFDTNNFDPIAALVYEWQVYSWSRQPVRFQYSPASATPCRTPLSRARIALITAGGIYSRPDHGPTHTQDEAIAQLRTYIRGKPTLLRIGDSTPNDALGVRHPGYDVRAAELDPETVFPRRAMGSLHEAGIVGKPLPQSYSFVGACSQEELIRGVADEWARTLIADGADGALLVGTCPLCHMSVAHLAVAFESQGLATVVIATKQFEQIMRQMGVARALITPHLMGRTVGQPLDDSRHRLVVEQALGLLDLSGELNVIDLAL